jgi:antitoxin YefM
MDAITYSEVRATLAKAMDRVCEDHEPLIITRQGKPSAVLISLEDYESMDETAYLARSPENARRLTKAIKEIEKGKVVNRRLEDLTD